MLRFLSVVVLGLGASFLLLPKGGAADKPASKLRRQIRRPVALVVQGDHLFAGNRQSGSLTVINRSKGVVLAEHEIARSLADMVPLSPSSDLLVLDDVGRELLKVSCQEGRPVEHRLAELPFAGSKLAWDEDHRRVCLTAKWAHRVMVLTMDEDRSRAVRTQTIKLPFAPLELLPLPQKEKLLVAEAFGNRLAVLDVVSGTILHRHEIAGHNIRGLALSEDGQSVLIAHQQIPDKAVASYDGVHWGRIVTNAVQVLEVAKLLKADSPKQPAGWLNTFGDVGHAAADPGEVLAGPEGLIAVAFTGVAEVSILFKKSTRRVPVGNAPEAMAADGRFLYVANRLDDSISVIDLAQGKVIKTISLGPAPELTSQQRGEKLFFNARLSHDGWLSCHSCHTEGHTAGLVVDTLGDGDYGAPKLVPSLRGVRDTQPWGWDGRMELLREQIQQSVTTTMHGDPISAREMEDMFAYITSLDSPPPPEKAPQELLAEGQAVFEARGCVDCHAPPAYTTPVTVDVSLLDEQGRSRFNPPSLRGVSQRRRFFHDGRAKSLEDVLQKVGHQLEVPLRERETQALLAFLRSL